MHTKGDKQVAHPILHPTHRPSDRAIPGLHDKQLLDNGPLQVKHEISHI